MEIIRVLVGTEPVRLRQILAEFRAQSGSWEPVSAAELSPEEALAGNLFMNEDAPLVRIIYEYPKWTAAERKRFCTMLSTLPQGLVILVVVRQLGEKDPLRKAVDPAHITLLNAPKPGAFVQWVRQYAQSNTISIQSDAAAELVFRVGERTEALANEIEKLAYLDAPITKEIVETLTVPEEELQSWGWVDAVVERNARTAYAELAKIEVKGETTPLALTGALTARILAIAWKNIGCSAEDVGLKPFPWKKAVDASRQYWNREHTIKGLEAIAQAEDQLKGASTLPEWTIMTRLVHQLVR